MAYFLPANRKMSRYSLVPLTKTAVVQLVGWPFTFHHLMSGDILITGNSGDLNVNAQTFKGFEVFGDALLVAPEELA